MAASDIIPVILCGGSGERLWPYSNERKPKALLSFSTRETMLQETVRRFSEMGIKRSVIVTLAQWADEALAQAKDIAPDIDFHCLREPVGKGTLPAITIAALYIQDQWPDSWAWFMPCDHYFVQEVNFNELLQGQMIWDKELTLFGIKPDKNDNAYGFVRTNNDRLIGFVEKPDSATASLLTAQGGFWNTAIYFSKVCVLYEIIRCAKPELLAALERRGFEAYSHLEKTSFERDVLSFGHENIRMIEIESRWHDVGRWKNIWETAQKDENGNVLQGSVLCDNVQNSLVYGDKRIISCIGLKDTVVIDAENTILVAHIDSAESLRALIVKTKELKAGGRALNYEGVPQDIADLLEGSMAGNA